MAVGVVGSGAFTAVVTALTKDLLPPYSDRLIAVLVGKPDFSAIKFSVNGSVFALGDFINALVSFFLIALMIRTQITTYDSHHRRNGEELLAHLRQVEFELVAEE